ncbi:MAG: alpha/beta fold hydrolase [Rhodospirillaceae bacterium]|nr:alpha/beta fold hydrolase [Rhodospirillaceae bacterium]
MIEAGFVREFFAGAAPYPMYVQEWGPAGMKTSGGPATRPPLVFIHGGSHSGLVWTTAPDGSPGWARLMAARGWPSYVVDWPGSGRSGCEPEDLLALRLDDIAAAVAALLGSVGPAILIGHSIGAAVAYKTAERVPAQVRAIAALASAPTPNGGIRLDTVPVADPGKPVRSDRAGALARLASGTHFSMAHFDAYFASLVAYGPRIRNGALGGSSAGRADANDDFRIDDVAALRRVPILFATVADDRTSPAVVSRATAQALGADFVSLDADWGLPGFGHMFPVETGNGAILDRIEAWLIEKIGA